MLTLQILPILIIPLIALVVCLAAIWLIRKMLKRIIKSQKILNIVSPLVFILLFILLGIVLTFFANPRFNLPAECKPVLYAKSTLDMIRRLQKEHFLEKGVYADSAAALYLDHLTICNSQDYFSYEINNSQSIAKRCIQKGKDPNAKNTYTVTIDYNSGNFTFDGIKIEDCNRD